MKKSQIEILVVDDDVGMQTTLQTSIKNMGYKVTLAGRPDEALNLVKIKTIHLAIIDCMLPKMNGIDLACALRKSRFGEAPIILISGIFKDRTFMADAIRKTGAVSFLPKPFDMVELETEVRSATSHLIESDEVQLHTLISKKLVTSRDRGKVIERLEEIQGYDLPFVISMILDSSLKGHLNIISENGDISGLTFCDGRLTKVDTLTLGESLKVLLSQQGHLGQGEIEQLLSDRKIDSLKLREFLESLVAQSYLSPHLVDPLQAEIILQELRSLLVEQKMQINFSPERKLNEDGGVTFEDVIPLFSEAVEKVISWEHLKAFYTPWFSYPVRLREGFSLEHRAFTMPIIKNIIHIADYISKEWTIEEILLQENVCEADCYQAIHFLALCRLISFDEVARSSDLLEYTKRIDSMLKELNNKNPFEVFAFFGAGESPRPSDVDKIYKEFAKSNHPDHLPQGASEDLVAAVTKLFSIVSEAHGVLTDDKKRAKLQERLKQQSAEQQIQAEALTEAAVIQLRRGRAKEALDQLREAYALYSSDMIRLYLHWAEIKASGSNLSPEALNEISKSLDSFPLEDRRNAIYCFVVGLYKKATNDLEGAGAQWDKALNYDPNFLEARRELGALSKASVHTDKFDLLSGDLTQIVSSFFKKKAK